MALQYHPFDTLNWFLVDKDKIMRSFGLDDALNVTLQPISTISYPEPLSSWYMHNPVILRYKRSLEKASTSINHLETLDWYLVYRNTNM